MRPPPRLFVIPARDAPLAAVLCRGPSSWTHLIQSWLHALTLWPAGTTYGGGGRFIDDQTIMLRTPNPRAHADHPNTHLRIVEGHAQPHDSGDTVDGAQWSGTDASGAVTYARDGVLFRRARGKDRVVRDLCGREPTTEPAPDWARHW